MGAFRNAVTTERGKALLAKAVAGEVSLQFTKVAVSEELLAGELTQRTTIGAIKQESAVSVIWRENSSTVSVGASFSNEKLEQGYYARNIGLYALDGGQEILFSISVASDTADYMPANTGAGISSLSVNLSIAISDATKIAIVVDNNTYATVSQILDIQQNYLPLAGGVVDTLSIKNSATNVDYGGELRLRQSESSTLEGDHVYVSTVKDTFRVAESGGSYRGAYLDIPECGVAWQTKLLHTGNISKYALPITGGTLTGGLVIERGAYPNLFLKDTTSNSYGKNEFNANSYTMSSYDTNGDARGINIKNPTLSPDLKDALSVFQISDGAWTSYRVFGEHNKPLGQYIGNGDAMSRTIDIGGIGYLLFVYCPEASWHCILSAYGGFAWGHNGTYKGISMSEARFIGGKLILTLTDGVLNQNNYNYVYQVL